MKINFRFIYLILIIGVIALAGCSNDSGGNTGTEVSENTNENENNDNNGKVVEIDFWHAISGTNGKVLEDIVNDFNEQSDSIKVNAVFQGGYNDLITKIRAMSDYKDIPAIIQAATISRKYLNDSDFIDPIQNLIDEYEDFDTALLEDSVYNFYQVDDTLYSMPFSASVAVMYYNKDLFAEVGLDPDNPPSTFEEIESAAKKITESTDSDGITMATDSWYFEQMLANQNALYLNNENGYSDNPTESLVNSEAGVSIFNWLKRMIDDKTFVSYGSDMESARVSFLASQVGMYFDSSAGVSNVVGEAPFEVGTAPLPVPEGVEAHGEIIGGNSNYVMKEISDEEKSAAWEFLKYTASPEAQAKWAAGTGYVPVSSDAYDLDVLTKIYEDFPQMLTAADIVKETKLTIATKGPFTEDHVEFGDMLNTAIERLYSGGNPQELLDEAADKMNSKMN